MTLCSTFFPLLTCRRRDGSLLCSFTPPCHRSCRCVGKFLLFLIIIRRRCLFGALAFNREWRMGQRSASLAGAGDVIRNKQNVRKVRHGCREYTLPSACDTVTHVSFHALLLQLPAQEDIPFALNELQEALKKTLQKNVLSFVLLAVFSFARDTNTI